MSEPLDRVGMLQLACRQYEDTLVAVHAALDETLGRDHRTRDDSAAASIRRLAAECRGADPAESA